MPIDEPDPDDEPTAIERVEQTVRETFERATEAVGEIADKIDPTVYLPSPIADVPEKAMDAAGEAVDWVRRQVEPVTEKLGPFEDYAPPSSPEPEPEDESNLLEWMIFAAVVAWVLSRELGFETTVDEAVWEEDFDNDSMFSTWNETVFVPSGPYAARVGDPMMHGDPAIPGAGSPTVFIGGRAALRVCDTHKCTKATPVPHVGAGFQAMQSSVEIDGFAALRIGDFVDEGPHGPNPIVLGLLSVEIGPTAPPVRCKREGEKVSGHRPEVFPFRWTKGKFGHFEGKVGVGVDILGPFIRVEGTVTAAHLWAEETSQIDVPLGDPDGDGKREVERITTKSKIEQAFGVSDVTLEVRPTWPGNKVPTKKITPQPNPDRKQTIEWKDSEVVELDDE